MRKETFSIFRFLLYEKRNIFNVEKSIFSYFGTSLKEKKIKVLEVKIS